MSISFLFLLLLFIEGFSPQDVPYNHCTYDGTDPTNKYQCLPKEDCMPVSDNGFSVFHRGFKCSSVGYAIEISRPISQSWLYSGSPTSTCSTRQATNNEFARCRKIRACDMTDYFNSTLCDDPLYNCFEPKIINKTVKCEYGELETFLFEEWKKRKDTVVCEYDRLKYESSSFVSSSTVQALRCKEKVCHETEVNKQKADKPCLSPECVAISTDKSSIRCPDGYNLEGHNIKPSQGVWKYFDSNSAHCSDLTISPSGVDESDKYDKYRCRKQRSCDTTSLFVSSLCDKQQSCKEVILKDGSTTDYHCLKGYELQYIPVGPQNSTWEKANKLISDCDLSRLIVVTAENISNIIPKHVRCMKDKLCDPELFFDPIKCDVSSECKSPRFVEWWAASGSGFMDCNSEFGLQAEFDEGVWIDIKTATCSEQSFSILYYNEKTDHKYPLALRCVRMKISEIDDNFCKKDELCEKPFNCNPIKCADNFHLLMKIDEEWKEMESSDKEAKCNSNSFYLAHKSGKREEMDRNVKLRCVQKKCTHCANPCPTCVEAAFTFTVPTKWGDECSEFKCGPNTQPVVKQSENEPKVYENGTLFECTQWTNDWNVNNDHIPVESIECQYFCTLESPITTLCYGNNETCRPITLLDTAAINECPTMYYEPNNKTRRTPIDVLECDRTNGSWIATQNGVSTKTVVPKGSNVYCFNVEECDLSKYLPRCADEEEECRAYTQKENTFHCDDSFAFWSREDYSNKWIKMDGIFELECRAGQILANEIPVSYEFQATCRPKSEAMKVKGESKLGLYLGVTFMILILIVIIIATVILRVTGNGWLHTIIIEKARGNKKRGFTGSRTFTASSKASGKTPSIKSPNTTTSRKSTKRTQRKVATKVARPSSSHSSLPGATSDSVTSKNKPAVKENVIVV